MELKHSKNQIKMLTLLENNFTWVWAYLKGKKKKSLSVSMTTIETPKDIQTYIFRNM